MSRIKVNETWVRFDKVISICLTEPVAKLTDSPWIDELRITSHSTESTILEHHTLNSVSAFSTKTLRTRSDELSYKNCRTTQGNLSLTLENLDTF